MKILVIEDTLKHLKDAKEYVSKLTNCLVDYATTLTEAMNLLEKNEYDAVISDVFFPADNESSGDTYENALVICEKLKDLGVYHVFNTSLHHHGDNDIREFVSKRNKILKDFNLSRIMEVFPCVKWNDSGDFKKISYPFRMGDILESNIDGKEVDTKQWEGSFRQVILAHEARPVILENRLKISESFVKSKDDNYEEFHSVISKIYACSITTSILTPYDYGWTTGKLKEDYSNNFSIQEVFERYNA